MLVMYFVNIVLFFINYYNKYIKYSLVISINPLLYIFILIKYNDHIPQNISFFIPMKNLIKH